ncbi:putative reverse transcriptase domain-containing protein [Tanacetum coccineum]
MAEPLSPDHEFDFPAVDLTLDLKDPVMEVEEDPEEEPEEDPEEVIPPVAASPPGSSPIIPPPLSESSSDSEFTAPVTSNGTLWEPPSGSIFEAGEPSYVPSLPPYLLGREIAATRIWVDRVQRRMDAFDVDLGFIDQDATRTRDDVLALQEGRARDQEKIRKFERRVDALEVSNTLVAIDRDRMEREFFSMRVWLSKVIGWGAVEARPRESIDVLAVYGDAQRSEIQGPPDRPQTMPPKRLKGRAVERLVTNRVAEAIAVYERNKTNPKGARGSGGNAREDTTPEVRGCSYKTFLNCKPHSFNETEGVVGLSHWFKKMESVFEISKYSEEDKVMYVVCTLEGRALTWWNSNVHSLGINVANRIPWNELKTMMTAEYCSRTEIQKMEQELWALSMKGGDINGYTNHFHELAVMCPTLVTCEYQKVKRYVWGLLERIQGNVTSSKPANVHEAIYQQRNNSNRNNTHHQQQNRRHEAAKAYVAGLAEGRGYQGNLPLCNRYNLHHNGQCPPKCIKCQRTGHQEKDCRARTPATGGNSQQNVTCYGCRQKGHYRNKFPKRKDQHNEGARRRAYVMRTKEPQQK